MKTENYTRAKVMKTENYTRAKIIAALRRFDEGSIGDIFTDVSTEELYERLDNVSKDYTADDLIEAVDEGF